MSYRSPLALLPTPIAKLERLSALLGVEVWVKRDDLTGMGMSGNKVRKLEFLLAEAVEQGADTVITCGGAQSNHARATAVACRQLGLEPVLVLREPLPAVPESNLLLDSLLGARVIPISPERYREDRQGFMEEVAAELRAKGRKPFIIPEGGSNGVGSLGYVAAAEEVWDQGVGPFDHVVVAVGSGGTLAGLALGPWLGPIRGVAVCDDRPYFAAKVREIAGQIPHRSLGKEGRDWEVVEGYQGPAYAVATPEIWESIALVARLEGLLLDPVYTGKAMHALLCEVRAGRWQGRLLFWHTGGAFGLFGRGAELPE